MISLANGGILLLNSWVTGTISALRNLKKTSVPLAEAHGQLVLLGRAQDVEISDIESLYFAFVTRHLLTSQYSSSGVIESLNDLYLDLKST